MLIRVYNQSGRIKIAKICNLVEHTIYSDLGDGEMAEIEVSVSQCTRSYKKKIGDRQASNEPQCVSFEKAITILESIVEKNVRYTEEMLAIQILQDAQAGKLPEAENMNKQTALAVFSKPIKFLQFSADNHIISTEEANRAVDTLTTYGGHPMYRNTVKIILNSMCGIPDKAELSTTTDKREEKVND